MKKFLALSLIAIAIVSCTSESNARRTLDDSGYTNVEITGYKMFTCGKDDGTATGFRAKNPAGKMVEGTVCCGYVFKGCTIRF